jgi:hypothetical protein
MKDVASAFILREESTSTFLVSPGSTAVAILANILDDSVVERLL